MAGGSPALAQSFNLDAGTELGLPDPSYGGAAAQPGQWQVLNFNVEQTLALTDLDGHETGVTITSPLPFGPAFALHDGPTGNDEKLLEDYLDLHSTPATFEVSGLVPGRYAIYTYAWPPDDSRYGTFITIGEESHSVGGAWPGGFEEDITHARIETTVSAGQTLGIQTFGRTKGTLNGIQIVALDAAGAEEPALESSPEVAPEAAMEPSPESAEASTTTRHDDGCSSGAPSAMLGLLAALGVLAARVGVRRQ